jgi:hypothetical protein
MHPVSRLVVLIGVILLLIGLGFLASPSNLASRFSVHPSSVAGFATGEVTWPGCSSAWPSSLLGVCRRRPAGSPCPLSSGRHRFTHRQPGVRGVSGRCGPLLLSVRSRPDRRRNPSSGGGIGNIVPTRLWKRTPQAPLRDRTSHRFEMKQAGTAMKRSRYRDSCSFLSPSRRSSRRRHLRRLGLPSRSASSTGELVTTSPPSSRRPPRGPLRQRLPAEIRAGRPRS